MGKKPLGLYPNRHPKTTRAYVDYDYVRDLGVDARAWLAKFTDEYYGAAMGQDSAARAHRDVKAKRNSERCSVMMRPQRGRCPNKSRTDEGVCFFHACGRSKNLTARDVYGRGGDPIVWDPNHYDPSGPMAEIDGREGGAGDGE